MQATRRSDESGFVPKLTLSYRPRDQMLWYATAAQGFRPGGPNYTPVPEELCGNDLAALGLASAPDVYEADTLWNYEIGFKGRWRTDDVPRIVVSFAGLDLTSQKGAEVLYSRIRSAAKIVCRVNESREQHRIARAHACYRSALEDAVAQVNRPLLSEVHARRTGRPEDVVRSASR